MNAFYRFLGITYCRVKTRSWDVRFLKTKLPRVIRWRDFEGRESIELIKLVTLKNHQFMKMYIYKVYNGKTEFTFMAWPLV